MGRRRLLLAMVSALSGTVPGHHAYKVVQVVKVWVAG